MSIYFPPSLRYFEPSYLTFSTWMDHLPFAYDIIEAVKPKLFVELGTFRGLSYFAFCQSIKEHDMDALCYSVDTWEGDVHTGGYGEEIFKTVNQFNRQNYTGFSYLLRMLFNDALRHFDDGSLDLIHIDGLHTYDAVKEDFTNWYPKVRPGGVMLFHDVAARIKDFGVWKYWEELSKAHNTFTFNHGFGLGVLRKPGGAEETHPLVNLLFNSSKEEQEVLRKFYVHAAQFLDLKRKVMNLQKQ